MSARPQVDPLVREKREIEARRKRLEARRQRILDAKTRTKGVDREGIEKQLAEKRERAEAEKRKEAELARMMASASDAAAQAEAERYREDRAAAAAARREQELQHTLAQAEARAKRDAERQYAATSLDFAGEDLGRGERVKAQAAQQRGWIRTQLQARQSREEQDRQRREAEDAELLRVTKIAEDLERASLASRGRQAASVAKYNAELAARKKELERRQHALDTLQNQREIEGQVAGQFLTEDKAASRSAVDPRRHIPYAFKGFTAEERQRILDEQRGQIEDRKRRMAAAAAAEADEHERDVAVQRLLARQQREQYEAEQQDRKQLAAEQVKFGEERAARERELNSKTYSNEVREDFFAQFGTSAR